jgi:hypothetical protein
VVKVGFQSKAAVLVVGDGVGRCSTATCSQEQEWKKVVERNSERSE